MTATAKGINVMNTPLSTSQEPPIQFSTIASEFLHQQTDDVQPSGFQLQTEPAKEPEERAPERVGASENFTSNANTNVNDNTVGEYVLGETIGKGTFGKVKLGMHVLTGEKVAVKILEKKRIIRAADMDRVVREIKILKRNRHPNVIQLYEVIDAPDHIYLIMEHVDGGEMFEYIVAHRRICEPEAAYLFRQIVDGLAYLHSNKVTHRDLKPENLLLQSNPNVEAQSPLSTLVVKIVDFGLSNMHDGGRLLRTACGSPCYAAPEMIQGRLYCGPVADMWSLGVVLFAMVCGYLPFEDSNTNMLYKKILNANYTMPTFLSANVQDLIRRILETDPEKRYTVDNIRQHPWLADVETSHYTLYDIYGGVPSQESTARHELILTELESMGLLKDDVLKALSEQSFNRFTASYYLLNNKLQRTMRDSIPPLSSLVENASRLHEEYKFDSDKDRQQKSIVRSGDRSIRNPEAVRSEHNDQERSQPPSRYNYAPHQTQYAEVSCPRRHVTPLGATGLHDSGFGLAQRPKSMRGGRNLVLKNGSAESSRTGFQPIAPTLPREHRHSGVLLARKSPNINRVHVNNGSVVLRPLVHPPRRESSSATPRRHTTEQQLLDPSRLYVPQPPHHLSINSTSSGIVIPRRPSGHVLPPQHATRTQKSPYQAPVRPTVAAEVASVSKVDDTRLPQPLVQTLSTNL
ncbi:camk camkl ampk protein kinase [Plasmopara halstedii]|uniref:non-specific serine/threonine protein kinase n=1 Tax=Plasmopara halstedii TaxID=4781 RepID=A0A0P1AK09_PLAHL|nr:camk camkl ampk protein kinase [Plasmopara halstedii]CEG41704.1 camk camkl ampk protein kinase [Plasmopara halstedii]|eukprot:XP_024578073.1 camk camkl ampk protein kinase [Plasmopara halstedii]